MSIDNFDGAFLRQIYLEFLQVEAEHPGRFTKEYVTSLRSPHDYLGYFIGVVKGSCEWIYHMPQLSIDFAIKAGADFESLQTFIQKLKITPSVHWEKAAIKSNDPIRALSNLQKLGVDLKVTVKDVYDFCPLDDNVDVVVYVKEIQAKREITALWEKLDQLYGEELGDHMKDVHATLDALSK